MYIKTLTYKIFICHLYLGKDGETIFDNAKVKLRLWEKIGYEIFVNNFLFSGKGEDLFIIGFNNSAAGDINRDTLRSVIQRHTEPNIYRA